MIKIRQLVSRCPESSQRRCSPFARWLVPLVFAAASVSLAADPTTGPIDIDPGVIKTPAVIDEWVKAHDVPAMKGHAWELLVAIMRDTGRPNPLGMNRGLTVYETWAEIDEALPEDPDATDTKKRFQPEKWIGPSLRPLSQQSHGLKAKTVKQKVLRLDAPPTHSQPSRPGLASDVRYSPKLVEWIGKKSHPGNVIQVNDGKAEYALCDKLNTFQNTNPAAPLTDWEVAPEEDSGLSTSAVMIKPCFTIVKKDKSTIISIWDERQDEDNSLEDYSSTNPSSMKSTNSSSKYKKWTKPKKAPTIANEKWWQSKIIVVPPGKVAPVVFDNEGKQLPSISVDQFLSLTLTETMASELNSIRGELGLPGTAAEGDYAILIAMHVSTHEINDWVWQTFWWTHNPYTKQQLIKHEHVTEAMAERILDEKCKLGFLKFFRGGVGYSSIIGGDNSGGDPVICSNPYLEGPFGPAELNGIDRFIRPEENSVIGDPDDFMSGRVAIGMRSNCVTCHRAAAYPNALSGLGAEDNENLNYTDFGKLNAGNERIFRDRLKTLYIWGVANKTSDYSLPCPPKTP